MWNKYVATLLYIIYQYASYVQRFQLQSHHTCVTLTKHNPQETSTMMKTVCLAALAGSAAAFAPAQVVSFLNIMKEWI